MYFDKKGSITREQPLEADPDKEEYQSVAGLENIELNIQPANAESTALSEGVFGKTYTAYTTHSGIKDGDRLTVSGTFIDGLTQNKTLDIRAVGNWNFPPLPHFEITCVEVSE